GTAYTKCVVRDAMVRDPGEAFVVPFRLPSGANYLLPSVVYQEGGKHCTALDTVPSNAEHVDYLKMRLVAVVDSRRAGQWKPDSSEDDAEAIVGYFLARVLAEVGSFLRLKWPDFGNHPEDYCMVNICVPIAHADGSTVEGSIKRALAAARSLVGPAGTTAP